MFFYRDDGTAGLGGAKGRGQSSEILGTSTARGNMLLVSKKQKGCIKHNATNATFPTHMTQRNLHCRCVNNPAACERRRTGPADGCFAFYSLVFQHKDSETIGVGKTTFKSYLWREDSGRDTAEAIPPTGYLKLSLIPLMTKLSSPASLLRERSLYEYSIKHDGIKIDQEDEMVPMLAIHFPTDIQ